MPVIVGVSFRKNGRVFYFDPVGFAPVMGDKVVVETSRGLDVGDVVIPTQDMPLKEDLPALKPVLRIATPQDHETLRRNQALEKEAMVMAPERIAAHNLDMKLVSVEYAFDGNKATFFFTSDGRVDFRELVHDLAGRLHMRIELRQIGVRDETKMKGGIGPCGRAVCCSTFLDSFHPVSIKMAKEQNISLNPTKISGLCGRLMCCLEYEHEFYAETRNAAPRIGARIQTPDGPGEVHNISVIRQEVVARVVLPDQTVEQRRYAFDIVKPLTDDEHKAALEQIAVDRPAPPPRREQNNRGTEGRDASKRRPIGSRNEESAAKEGEQATPNSREHQNRPRRDEKPEGESSRDSRRTTPGPTGQQGRKGNDSVHKRWSFQPNRSHGLSAEKPDNKPDE